MESKQRLATLPRFGELSARSPKTSRVAAANRSEDTTPEVHLRRALWAAGVRYRLHARDLPGRPDIVIRRLKIAVFCDGDFWHGRNWRWRKARLATGWNPGYWVAKIDRNRERDKKQSRKLRRLGWRVLRFWETDVLRDPTAIAAIVGRHIEGHRKDVEQSTFPRQPVT